VLDGVFRTTRDTTVFHPVRAPSAEPLQILLNQIIKRIMEWLSRIRYGRGKESGKLVCVLNDERL
jgi:hypothetical protein